MKLSKQTLIISSFLNGLAYLLLIVNLIFMNFNVLIGRPAYLFVNVSLGLVAMLLCVVVLYMRKGTDNTPLFGLFLNLYSIIIVMGTVFFFEG